MTYAAFSSETDPPRIFVNAPGWTDERVARLKFLYAAGLSASRIAADLQHISRNGVISKVHRLGLELRGKNNNYSGNQHSKPGPKPKPRPRTEPRPTFRATIRHESPELKALRCAEIEPRHISLEQLTSENCHYPYGDGPFVFCGHVSLKGQPYCLGHYALTHKPTRGA